MEDTLIRPPRTIMEVFKMLPETTLAEVINDTLYMSPAPSPYHQRILKTIFKTIDHFIEAKSIGELFVWPVDLFLDEQENAVQPDLVHISKTDPVTIDQVGLHGIPSMIIEILSPGNSDHDTITKKELYQKFKVQEYWIIDPKTKKAIGYTLSKDQYILIEERIGSINSLLLKNSFSF